MKWLMIEWKRMLKQPVVWSIAAFLLVAIVFVVISDARTDEQFVRSLYGVEEYATQEELKEQIDEAAQTVREKTEEYNQALADGTLTSWQAEMERENIRLLERGLRAMEALYDKGIGYNDVVSFGATDLFNDWEVDNAAGELRRIVEIFAFVVMALTSIKLLIKIPTEIREGQYKLTMTLPVGRNKYALLQWLLYTFIGLTGIVFVWFAGMAISMIVFRKGGYVLYAYDGGAFVTDFFATGLLQLALSAILLLCCNTTALALSLTVSNRGVLVVLHILLCLSGRLFELAQYVVGDSVQFVGYLYPCALDFLGCYRIGGLGLYLNSVFISVLFAVAISCILLSGALVFFKKRNLK